MPDWTYHPVWRPVMFRLPAEDARRLTVGYLELQGRTKVGRELFRLLSYGLPDPEEAVEVFGLSFPARFGLGPGLDTDGRGLRVSQYLGCGFLTVGPVSLAGRPRVRALDRIRVTEHHALAWSDDGYAPSAHRLAANLATHAGILELPVGIVVHDPRPTLVIQELADHADFFSVVDQPGFDAEALRLMRDATTRPVLLRLSSNTDDSAFLDRAALAKEEGLDGVVVGDGEPYPGLPHAWLSGVPGAARTLRLTRLVTDQFGDELAVVASGALLTPDDAAECRAAGAGLVEITSGFVFSGPGIAGRSVAAARRAEAAEPIEPVGAEPPSGDFTAAGKIFGLWGLLVAAFAALVALLPRGWLDPLVEGSGLSYAAALLGCAFLAGGVAALARRGQPWVAWLALATAVLSGLASLVVAGIGLLAVLVGEASAGWLRRGFRGAFDRGVPAWRWSAANLGRRSLEVGAVTGAVAALSADAPAALRGLVAGACTAGFLLLERGRLPGARPLWFVLLGWYAASATSVATLLEGWVRYGVLAAVVIFGAMGLSWLWCPLIHLDEGADRFPDV